MSDHLDEHLKKLENYIEAEKKEAIKTHKVQRHYEVGWRSWPINKILIITAVSSLASWYYSDTALQKAEEYALKKAKPEVAQQIKIARGIIADKKNQIAEEAQSLFKPKKINDLQSFTKNVESSDKAKKLKESHDAAAKAGDFVSREKIASERASDQNKIYKENYYFDGKDKWVRIEGQWHKKSEDNIYIVNGRRVLFIQNRQREPSTNK